MKKDVHQFVHDCQVCNQAKSDRAPNLGKLQPLPVSSKAWETISMDFIKELPHSSTANCILVIIDKFTKFARFIPIAHPYTTSSVAIAFMNMAYKFHGLPTTIISDRGLVFISAFWQSLFKLSGTTLKLSSTYHPQTDSQTECVNQCLKTFVRCFVHACPRKWKD
jgi:transposase InsO family protein